VTRDKTLDVWWETRNNILGRHAKDTTHGGTGAPGQTRK
jgi:hypothetical protein